MLGFYGTSREFKLNKRKKTLRIVNWQKNDPPSSMLILISIGSSARLYSDISYSGFKADTDLSLIVKYDEQARKLNDKTKAEHFLNTIIF